MRTLDDATIESLWDEVNEPMPCFPGVNATIFLMHSGYWDPIGDNHYHEYQRDGYWEVKRTFFLLILAAEGEL